ncbi:hypothetical protein IMCC21906_02061 [Spongiibacter sp. IMCC21906]|nr:hypothetical protein IMCC21906_02061 [Spongiibacter sp. IMCC21906]
MPVKGLKHRLCKLLPASCAGSMDDAEPTQFNNRRECRLSRLFQFRLWGCSNSRG